MPHKRLLRAALALAVAGSAMSASAASAALDEINTKRLRDAVTINGVMGHERALQRIANLNGGTRASGTPGYDASLAYVSNRLEAAGYDVEEQEFEFPFFRDLAAPTLTATVAGDEIEYETATFQYSGSGDVTGRIVPALNNEIPPGPLPTSSVAGCDVADFTPASATEDEIALVQRGGCNFAVKAANATEAGYDAVIIFNEGQEGRQELVTGTLGGIFTIPVIGLSFEDGAALQAATEVGDVEATVSTLTESNPEALTKNLIAKSPEGNEDEQVVVGAHLDSVVAGPGINDNGSGTSQNLEIAEELAELGRQPRRQLVFAFWGAEESGLLGSVHYVDELTDDELGQTYANLNFDMTGSRNYVRFVYDGDGSEDGTDTPPGSGEIESLFTSYFDSQGLASEPTPFDGRSDYGPFIGVGIPAGGLFAGAEGIKTPEQAAIYGGTAGLPYDPCYHLACDTINNLSTRALGEFADASAHATWTLARSRSGLFEDGSRVGRRGIRVKAESGPNAVK